jgi:hypothetical protein
MADDIVTNRLRTLAEVSDEDYPPTGDTVELEEMQLIETAELKQLLSPADEPAASDNESTDDLEVERDWTWVS